MKFLRGLRSRASPGPTVVGRGDARRGGWCRMWSGRSSGACGRAGDVMAGAEPITAMCWMGCPRIARMGRPRRDLPEAFGRWSSASRQLRRRTRSGPWETIPEGLDDGASRLDHPPDRLRRIPPLDISGGDTLSGRGRHRRPCTPARGWREGTAVTGYRSPGRWPDGRDPPPHERVGPADAQRRDDWPTSDHEGCDLRTSGALLGPPSGHRRATPAGQWTRATVPTASVPGPRHGTPSGTVALVMLLGQAVALEVQHAAQITVQTPSLSA